MKKVIIIGAGVAGLAEAVYLSRSGFDVTVLEKQDRCGGLCTTWKRGEYSFESCLYWVFGTNKSCSLNKIWRELGVCENLTFTHFENFMQLESEKDDICFPLWSDLSKLALELKKYGTGKDKKEIDKLLSDAKRIQSFNLYVDKPIELFNISDYFKLLKSYLPYLNLFIRYGGISLEQYVKRFESETLRNILLDFMQHIENYPMILNLLIFSYMDSHNADYPLGGSYHFSDTIKKMAIKSGTKFIFNANVKEIIIKDCRASGVILSDGKMINSDYVVSCCDGYNTIFKMLKGKYLTRKLHMQYEKLPVFLGYMQISFGIEKDLSDTMQFILYKLDKPIKIGADNINQLRMRHYSFNKNFAPDGCASLVVTFKSDFSFWNDLNGKSHEEYENEKQKACEIILKIVEKRYGELKPFIRQIDVATPKSFQLMTGNRNGSAEGWYTNCHTFSETFSSSIKGLKGFYMAGHWTNINGGVTFAALTARNVAQLICHDEKATFISEE